MWVHPRAENVALLWESLEENDYVALLKYRQSGFIGTKLLLGAAAAIAKPTNFKCVHSTQIFNPFASSAPVALAHAGQPNSESFSKKISNILLLQPLRGTKQF